MGLLISVALEMSRLFQGSLKAIQFSWSQVWRQRSLFSCSQEICGRGWQTFSKHVSQWGIQGKAAAELIDPSALVVLWIGISILNFAH